MTNPTITEHAGALQPWYADNSREGIRDETFRTWIAVGALRVDESVSTTSSRSRYSFAPGFAALLAPTLDGKVLKSRIIDWQNVHLTPTGRLRAHHLRLTGRQTNAVRVTLPGGGTRDLLVGPSSEILKGVIEEFARRLADPSVLFISQSGEKVNVVDQDLLYQLGLPVDQQQFLPDALIVDLQEERDEFWFVEVDATGGPIHEERKAQFLSWATTHGLDTSKCRFLTAFASRTHPEARRALSVLARGSHAWFNDEPDALLSWGDLAPS